MENELIPEKLGHRAGFVSLVGAPNVGKSTLMNALVGERLSIITSKAQTTRRRIMGILTEAACQLVFSDTPGMLDPAYTLQEAMMRYVRSSLEDADLLLYVCDPYNIPEPGDPQLELIRSSGVPVFGLLNKIDQVESPAELLQHQQAIEKALGPKEFYAISAQKNQGVKELLEVIKAWAPEHPPYFPEDQLTDLPERFFTAEMVREKIFLNYKKEIPYSTEVVVEEFKEEESIIRIRATIYTERRSQKAILIGKGGAALTKTGTMAREELERFFQKKIYLDLFVKVEENWRKNPRKVRGFGYGG